MLRFKNVMLQRSRKQKPCFHHWPCPCSCLAILLNSVNSLYLSGSLLSPNFLPLITNSTPLTIFSYSDKDSSSFKKATPLYAYSFFLIYLYFRKLRYASSADVIVNKVRMIKSGETCNIKTPICEPARVVGIMITARL